MSGIEVDPNTDLQLLCRLTHLHLTEVSERFKAGHRAYIVWIHNTPVGYGWLATRSAMMGELDISFHLPPDSMYLWDFATLPAWRGQGIYPQLLQRILQAEAKNAQYFWIAHAPENTASRRGIATAGFHPVGKLSFRKRDTSPALAPFDDSKANAALGAALLNVELLTGEGTHQMIAPCWGCTIRAKQATTFLPPICWNAACGCTSEKTR